MPRAPHPVGGFGAGALVPPVPMREGASMAAATSRLHALGALGQSVWVDALSRPWLQAGELRRLVAEDAVVGVTSNPSILEQALREGDAAYAPQLAELARRGVGAREALMELAVRDTRDACADLRATWERTDGRDGWVSLEVDPALADDAAATVSAAHRLRDAVGAPNAMIKIPATAAGVVAIEDAIAAGLPVNATLIFSAARHRAVAGAYVRGAERFLAAGGEAGALASVASFFVSRVDAEVDARLAPGAPLRGVLAIANAKVAYAQADELAAGERWRALAASGVRTQRCLWASTATKDPAYRDVRYVEELIGPDTVTTLPLETLARFREHGEAAPTLTAGVAQARAALAALADAGVDFDDVVAVLERAGVARFQEAFETATAAVERRLSEAA